MSSCRKRAKIIHAKGELAASKQLQKAASAMAQKTAAIQLDVMAYASRFLTSPAQSVAGSGWGALANGLSSRPSP
jgi:hypothetical protein